MDPEQLVLKRISKIALAAMTALLVIAIIFYKERVLFADTAYYAFNNLNYKPYFNPTNRYGAFITTIVPYLGRLLHLSLKTILFCYAISFNLFFLSVNILLVYRFKQYGLAVLMAVYYFLFVSDSSFLLCAEIHEAIAWMFLFFAISFFLICANISSFTRILNPNEESETHM